MSDLVSIIMPSYNTGKFICDSIDSILKQTYENWELIIIDDCSSDDTDEAVKGFNDDRIRFYKNEKNSGAAFSRNRGLKLARGRWIAFLDSDDLWLCDKLEKQIGFMEKNGFSFSYTEYTEIDENSNKMGITVSGPSKITERGMFDYCWPGCLTVMYDADKIGLIQIEDIRKNNDYAMWLKACKKADCHLLKEPLAEYRRGRSGSISTHGCTELIKWHYRLYRIAEKQSPIISATNTVRNIMFGIYKKIRYVSQRS